MDLLLYANQSNAPFRALFYARRYKEAEEQFKRVLAMDQSFVYTYFWLTSALALQGKSAEAYDWFKKYLAYRKANGQTVRVFDKAFPNLRPEGHQA